MARAEEPGITALPPAPVMTCMDRPPPANRIRASVACLQARQAAVSAFHSAVTSPCAHLLDQRACRHAIRRHWPALQSESAEAPGCGSPGCALHTVLLGDLNVRALTLLLQSFLATQPCESTFTLWCDSRGLASARSALALLDGCAGNWQARVQAKPVRLLPDLPLGELDLSEAHAKAPTNGHRMFLADLIRFRVLQQHGGIYIDADTILLADLTPLCHAAFAYRWAHSARDRVRSARVSFNNAVIGCPVACAFITNFTAGLRARRKPRHLAKSAYHARVWPLGQPWSPLMLPTQLFDPLWLRMVGYDTLAAQRNATADAGSLRSATAFDRRRFHVPAVTGEPAFSFVAPAGPHKPSLPAAASFHWHGGPNNGIRDVQRRCVPSE